VRFPAPLGSVGLRTGGGTGTVSRFATREFVAFARHSDVNLTILYGFSSLLDRYNGVTRFLRLWFSAAEGIHVSEEVEEQAERVWQLSS